MVVKKVGQLANGGDWSSNVGKMCM
jgi:hypothetical protein